MSSLCRLGPRKRSVDEFSVQTGSSERFRIDEFSVQTGAPERFRIDEFSVQTGAGTAVQVCGKVP